MFLVVGIPLLIAVGLTGLVCSIVAAIKASEGVLYQYPVTIRFVRLQTGTTGAAGIAARGGTCRVSLPETDPCTK